MTSWLWLLGQLIAGEGLLLGRLVLTGWLWLLGQLIAGEGLLLRRLVLTGGLLGKFLIFI